MGTGQTLLRPVREARSPGEGVLDYFGWRLPSDLGRRLNRSVPSLG